jgi:hypothetical protein
MGDCDEDFWNLDTDTGNGCEYHCIFASDAELCNNLDENCDGETDEDNPEGGADCYTGSSGCTEVGDEIICEGECAAGVETCINGNIICEGQIIPALLESCNGLDDDCDSVTDDGVFQNCGGADPFGCDTDIYPLGECPEGANQGICAAGVQFCDPDSSTETEPQWLACVGDNPPSDEICDALDNDCDGVVDEAEDIAIYDADRINQPCGLGACEGLTICDGGNVVCGGGEPADNETPCNDIDDNCNGFVDEWTSNYCGGCNTDDYPWADCTTNPSEGVCQAGTWTCSPDPVCVGSVGPSSDPDDCDGLDNDCDGQTDEDAVAPGACDTDCPGTVSEICAGNLGWQCQYDCSLVECLGPYGPPSSVETDCDGIDGDCDGTADDDFYLSSNPEHCGWCNNNCNTLGWTHVSEYYCLTGNCAIADCDTNWFDADSVAATGCECQLTDGGEGLGVETCDGLDNDCNGQTDEIAEPEICDDEDNDCDGLTDEDLTEPPWACNSNCPGSMTAFCTSTGWDCDYYCVGEGGDVECDLSGDPVANETLCDGQDNDCDGLADEAPGINNAASLGLTCDNGGTTGVCYVEGVYACASSPTADPVCCQTVDGDGVCITEVPAPADLIQPDELPVPNGLDDDCDGQTDEGADGCLTYVNVDYGPGDFDIFAYEASRPDATGVSQGSINTAPCSESGVLPWTMVTKLEAQSACQLLGGGWDLCTADQWEYACAYGGNSGSTPHDYPYGEDYVGWPPVGEEYAMAVCNGHDFNSTWDQLISTGIASNCRVESNVWGETVDIYDLSGNAEEWTSSQTSISNVYEIRGGSYNDQGSGMTCDFDFWAASHDFKMENLGYRCCRGGDPADLCASVTCDSPPADYCDGDTAILYDPEGECFAGSCFYDWGELPCPGGCSGGQCLDVDGDGYTTSGGDCDDFDALINPDALDLGPPDDDGIDNDCDGLTDEGLPPCTCDDVGPTPDELACALDVACMSTAYNSAWFESPTGVSDLLYCTEAVTRFGNATNDLDPQPDPTPSGDFNNNAYALVASGPATGTSHSSWVADTGGVADPFASGTMHNAVEFHVSLTAPVNAQGFSFEYVFFSEEYDEYVGSSFNDKFYAVLNAPITTSGVDTITNFTVCRDNSYYDFIDTDACSAHPLGYCCYIAINTALSECCWYPSSASCPSSQCATNTDIQGTGFSCYQPTSTTLCGDADSSSYGSSTGWLTTQYPIAPGETFTIYFHVHDTADGILDSEVLLDNFRWHTGETTASTFPS